MMKKLLIPLFCAIGMASLAADVAAEAKAALEKVTPDTPHRDPAPTDGKPGPALQPAV